MENKYIEVAGNCLTSASISLISINFNYFLFQSVITQRTFAYRCEKQNYVTQANGADFFQEYYDDYQSHQLERMYFRREIEEMEFTWIFCVVVIDVWLVAWQLN